MTTENIPNRSVPAVSGINQTLVINFAAPTNSGRRLELVDITASFDATPITPALCAIDRVKADNTTIRTFMGVITTSGLAPLRRDGYMAAQGEGLRVTLNGAGAGITGYLSACAKEF